MAPIVSSPAARTSSAAARAMPRRRAARHIRAGSPTGSAAAMSSSVRAPAGQSAAAGGEALLQTAGQRQRPGQPEAAGQPHRGAGRRKFEQREGIAVRLGEDRVADPLVQRPADDRVEQRPRVEVTEALDGPGGQAVELPHRRPQRVQHHHRLGLEPARDEREHPSGRLVEPLRVVDHAEKRLLGGRLAEQAERGQPDQERIGGAG
ncbi:hypothetical protein ACGFJ7_18440 [Actinoplanes sp. NPDC048988]|uniref:hypothetical protein n=1 Tax=Actinoplanes sp. NPDC048988 TaxID=3363901 RepID=UPI003722B168